MRNCALRRQRQMGWRDSYDTYYVDTNPDVRNDEYLGGMQLVLRLSKPLCV